MSKIRALLLIGCLATVSSHAMAKTPCPGTAGDCKQASEVSPASRDPAGVVSTAIKMDRQNNTPLFDEGPKGRMKEFFTKGFIADWDAAFENNKDGPFLDGDTIIGLQTVKSLTLKNLKVESTSATEATVSTTIFVRVQSDRSGPEDIKFILKREAGAWKIDDIGNSVEPSLHAYLVKSGPPIKPGKGDAHGTADVTLRKKVEQFLGADLPAEESKASIKFVDLNGDGVPEALVVSEGPQDCGSHGCSAFVLDLSGPAAKDIGSFIGFGLEPLSSQTRGWRDLSLIGSRGNHPVRFNGRAYGS
jgi:Protein of unknown function (DUF3828)